MAVMDDFPDKLAKDFPTKAVPAKAEPTRTGGVPPFAGSAVDPMVVAGKGLEYLRRPLKKAFDVAGQADVRAGIKSPATAASRANTYANIPISMAAGALTGGSGLVPASLAQMATTKAMQEGGLEATHPLGPIDVNVALSGASPFIAAGLGRLARGAGRAATRMLPGRFSEAQRAAQAEGAELAERLKPAVAAGGMLTEARKAGGEKITATSLQTVLDDLDSAIPTSPSSGGLKAAREFMDMAKGAMLGDQSRGLARGQIALGDLLRLRVDLGRSIGKGPEVQALYKAVLADLGQAGAAGGPGSKLALQGLEAARRERGAAMLADILDKSSRGRSAITGELPLLSMSTFGKEVQKARPELLKLIGPDGVAQIEEFAVRNRALPPTHAYTMANGLISTLLGGVGLGISGPAGGASVLGWELLKDAVAVGKNPVELQKFLVTLGAGLPGLAREAVTAKK